MILHLAGVNIGNAVNYDGGVAGFRRVAHFLDNLYLNNCLIGWNRSQIKNVLDPAAALFLAVAKGAPLVLNELELVFVQEEELATLVAALEQDFAYQVDIVLDVDGGVDFSQVHEVNRLGVQLAELLLLEHNRAIIHLHLLVLQGLVYLGLQGLVRYCVKQRSTCYRSVLLVAQDLLVAAHCLVPSVAPFAFPLLRCLAHLLRCVYQLDHFRMGDAFSWLELDQRKSLKAHVGDNKGMLTVEAGVFVRDNWVGHGAPGAGRQNGVFVTEWLGSD